MKTMLGLVLLTPLALVLAAAPAPAHGPRHGACREDLQRLCPGVTPGPGSFRDCLAVLCPDVTPAPGAFAACLQQHASELSAACQDRLARAQAKIAAWRQACGNDVQSFCADVALAPRAIFRCLRRHRDELSQSCQDLLAQDRGHHRCPTPTPAP